MLGLLAAAAFAIVPRPAVVEPMACRTEASALRELPNGVDPAIADELNERWRALGIGVVRATAHPAIRFVRDRSIAPQGYRLVVDRQGATIASSTADGAFYGAMTLAQLPVRAGAAWEVPCVRISDAPKLAWRVLSDDVSRGPLPTMTYFRERIRTIAAFKFNGYSPYMEHVFLSPTDPLPAPLDGITPSQLRDLRAYAARFHVTFIPEQQTFAHMHNTLRVEQYASAAEFPHGFLIAPGVALGEAYLERVIGQERAAVGPVPFFHIGSDETATLGEGATAPYVTAHGGRSSVYADHVDTMARLVAPARVMLWDDGIEADPSIMAHLPRNAVIINWHYGAEPSYERYIQTLAQGGFDQMVAPGANNWNELFPDLRAALPNERRFITEGIGARVFGLFQTVWHDDGETLYETTWYPVLFAGAVAWGGDAAGQAFSRDFGAAFFGSTDARVADDIATLGALAARVHGSSNKRFWADPFDGPSRATLADVDLAAVRLDAEGVERDLLAHVPPLHRAAADAMFLAARRFDALGRRYQIADEVRSYYDHARTHPDDAIRDLFWCKYWFWEQRDSDEELARLYERAWRYESRPGHLPSNLERYHLDAQLAIRRADAIDRVTYQQYVPTHQLPAFETIVP